MKESTQEDDPKVDFIAQQMKDYKNREDKGKGYDGRGKMHHEVFDQIYTRETNKLDRNLEKIQDYLKPQAHSIYYDRKIEYVNLVEQFKKHQKQQMFMVNKKRDRETKADFISDFAKKQKQLIELMKHYDIKHPLRGEGFENTKIKKQEFRQKILGVVESGNYQDYKKDHRQLMDQSQIKSESFLKQEFEKEQKQKIILKYRLYGKDGIDKHELLKLVEWGIIQKRNPNAIQRRIKIKKRKMVVKKNNETGEEEEYSTDVSGNSADCYQLREISDDQFYLLNDEAVPVESNAGFAICPLSREIFGKQASMTSRMKFKMLKEERSTQMNSTIHNCLGDSDGQKRQQFGGATYINFNQQKNRIQLPQMQTQRGPFGQRSESVALPFQSIYNVQSSINSGNLNLQSEQSSIPASALDISFLPKTQKLSPHAKNMPILKKQLFMPHLVNQGRNAHMNSTRTMMDNRNQNRSQLLNGHITIDQNSDDSPREIDHYNEQMHVLADGSDSTINKRNKAQFLTKPNPTEFAMSMRSRKSISSIQVKKSAMEELSTLSSIIRRDNRSINPASPFRYNTKVSFIANDKRKAKLNNRFNKMWTEKTPHIGDEEMQERLYGGNKSEDEKSVKNEEEKETKDKCPDKSHSHFKFLQDPNHPIYKAVNNKNPKEMSNLYRAAFDGITKQIDRMEVYNKQYYAEMLTNWVTSQIREEQLKNLAKVLQTLDYSEPEQINTWFENIQSDIKKECQIQIESMKEHKEGKLDPNKVSMKVKKKKEKKFK